jgi:hypothetical protein
LAAVRQVELSEPVAELPSVTPTCVAGNGCLMYDYQRLIREAVG